MYSLGLDLVTMETFVNQRSRSALPSMVYTTLENTLDQSIGSGSQLKAMCSVATIFDELTDAKKQLA